MPTKKVTKGKAKSVKKVARRPVAAKRKKAPKPLTYGKTRAYLERMGSWQGKLAVDLAAVTALVQEFPPEQPVPAAVTEKLRKVVTVVGGHPLCSPVPKRSPKKVR